MMKAKTISQSVYNADQSWYLDSIINIEDKKLRFQVRKNAYDNQSYGSVELWDGFRWNVVHKINGVNLFIKRSYVEKNVTFKDFEKDYEELMRVAREIIF